MLNEQNWLGYIRNSSIRPDYSSSSNIKFKFKQYEYVILNTEQYKIKHKKLKL